MCTVETRRLELMQQAAAVTNNTMNFNALSWPLGSALLYQKLSHPSESMLIPAAIATGLYGFLNAGIPGRDAVNRQAAKALACGVVDASLYLYTTQEINGEDTDEATLLPALRRLHVVIGDYADAADAVLAKLVLRKAVALPSDPISRLGRASTGGAGAGADGRARLAQEVDTRLDTARLALREGRQLAGAIRSSTGRLRGVFVATEAARESKLASAAPALRDPTVEITQIAAAVNKLNAQSGRRDTAPDNNGASTHRVELAAALASLDTDSRKAWAKLQVRVAEEGGEGKRLQTAVAEVQRWVEAHQNRKPIVAEAMSALGCADILPDNASDTKALPGKDSAGRPPTSSTPTFGTQLPSAAK
jgi:hypothetical protein